MKKEYCKPELDATAYAQFENVFTNCNKGNEKRGCSYIPGWSPSNPDWAAFKGNGSV
jgi:hypothetical protein